MRVRSKPALRSARSPRAACAILLALALLWCLPLSAVAQSTPATQAKPADAGTQEQPAAPPTSSTDQPPAHHHMNVSKTGPGPTGKLVQRSEAASEHLYQHLKGLYMSPYCPGLTLGSCGSSGAELLRADLREWVFEGHTEKDITSYMVATFGDEIMGRPPFHGTAILVWAAPVVAVLLGLWLAMRWIRRNSRRKQQTSATASPVEAPHAEADQDLDSQLGARVEAEIRARSI